MRIDINSARFLPLNVEEIRFQCLKIGQSDKIVILKACVKPFSMVANFRLIIYQLFFFEKSLGIFTRVWRIGIIDRVL